MSEKSTVTVPSGAAAGRKLGRSAPTVDATSSTDVGASRACRAAAATRCVGRDDLERSQGNSGAPCAARPIPHPRIGHTGQK